MECIEARALKSSFLSQMAMKTSSQVLCNDDVWCLAAAGNDDFPVEDLLNLDFSDKDFEEGSFLKEDEVSCKESSNNSSSSTFSGADELDSLSAGELAVPVDELENLEWLSQFVDDSSDDFSLLCPMESFAGVYSANRVEPANRPPKKTGPEFFPAAVRKPRSKFSRSRAPSWSLPSPLLSATGSLSPSSSNGSSILSPPLFMNPVHEIDWFSSGEKPAAKKQKKKQDAEGFGSLSGRRCTHCQVQKTPQWRAGPLGPKTLCNACGVRFKSGRLFPEYRPACSPTFSQAVHSNSHRKVLEMRKKKEMAAEPGFIQVVQSSSG